MFIRKLSLLNISEFRNGNHAIKGGLFSAAHQARSFEKIYTCQTRPDELLELLFVFLNDEMFHRAYIFISDSVFSR